jgi:hypothetical protein
MFLNVVLVAAVDLTVTCGTATTYAQSGRFFRKLIGRRWSLMPQAAVTEAQARANLFEIVYSVDAVKQKESVFVAPVVALDSLVSETVPVSRRLP